MTAMSFDVMTYMVLHHLQPSGDQKKVKGDLTTVAPWFCSMTQLTGSLYKRYPSLEMKGLLNFLTNALLKRSPHDLFILQVLFVAALRTLLALHPHSLALVILIPSSPKLACFPKCSSDSRSCANALLCASSPPPPFTAAPSSALRNC